MNNQSQYPGWFNQQMYNIYQNPLYFQQMYNMYMQNYLAYQEAYKQRIDAMNNNNNIKDYGPEPLVIDISKVTELNNTFRTVLWTGENLQVTLMSIAVGDDIGLEIHDTGDQFIRIEEGEGIVRMGDNKDNLDFQRRFSDDYAIMIPAGKWHNIINTGNEPIKLYAIYAPPEHPSNTVHQTKADAQASERNDRY